MHELSITRNVVALCAERAGDAKVTVVRLQIGKLAGVMPDAVRFCFDICTQDTALAGAELVIDEPAGLGCCIECNNEFAIDALYGICSCGSRNIRVVSGDEMKIKEMETA